MADKIETNVIAQKRLELARKINELIDRESPDGDLDNETQALALALMARTRATYPRELFGFTP